MRGCLFCKQPGVFQTREHIVPESLGNDTDILEGVICNSCQNYFGTKIEKAALGQTPIAFWRSYLGILKKGRLPSVNLDPPTKGAIPAFHPASDTGIGFSAHEDGSTSIDVDNPHFVQRLLSKDEGEYKMVLSPWHLSIIGRFLGKMGLEYVALSDLDCAFSAQFEDIRSFARYGSRKHLWPIYWGQQGRLEDLKESVIWDGPEGHQEIECYRYALARMVKDEMIFVFSIGVDLMAICLTKSFPIQNMEDRIKGTKLSCVFYPDGSW